MSHERLLKVLSAPHISEKATDIADHGQYVFKVQPDANKAEIKKAVELFFDVTVTKVNTLIRKGKVKRNARGFSKKSNIKLAYVSLEAGQEIDFSDTENKEEL
ncbi:MAG: 50S ribosomal protein L23 [Endozoicomonadaceae bacterium]|nr:50S ribosomal protein L23 [Endozoicomonadaceae bacterium]